MINSQQIRGARAMLGMTQAELAKRASLSTTGLNNIESGKADPKVSTMEAIQIALENAGADFRDGTVGLRPFRVGDRVKYRLGRAPDPMQWHAVGEIIEVEAYPILMGPVPCVRARIANVESAWTMPSEFEFGIETDEGFQRQMTR